MHSTNFEIKAATSKTFSIHGRFQIFHNGHLSYLKKAIDHCGGDAKRIDLIIGITQPNKILFKDTAQPQHRYSSIDNPLTYEQRVNMIKKLLHDEFKLEQHQFRFCKFSIDDSSNNLGQLISLETDMTTTLCDEWNLEKVRRLIKAGYRSVCVVDNLLDQPRIKSQHIRKLILNKNNNWKDLVPKSVVEYLQEIDIYSILKKSVNDNTILEDGFSK